MAEGLTTIHLGGALGARFGKKWQLMVSSPAEAIRAIDVNTGGKLRQYLSGEAAKRFYKVAVGKKDGLLEKGELTSRSGHANIYILPTVRGSNSGIGKIIAGVILIAAAIITQQYELLGPIVQGSFAAVAVTAGFTLGASLVLGGVLQLIAPNPNFNNNTTAAGASNIFNGNAASISQGGSVGLVYGRALVTPMPICLSFDNIDQGVTTDAGTTNYNQTNLPGGGYQWVGTTADS